MKVNDVFDRDIEYLYNSAKELGGTIREVACESGFFEAVDYIKIKIDPTIIGHTLTKEDIEPVEDDGSYNLWTEGSYYLGNGTNIGWLCHNYYGNELVKPDIFAVEQAMNTYYAECIIRRDENPYFYVEEIDFDDEEVFNNISKLIAQTLPANWLTEFLHGEMPVSYKVLAYQIAFIKFHYPKVYSAVWEACPPYLDMNMPVKEYDNVQMGITISEKKCCAAVTDATLVTKNVYNIFSPEQSVSEKVQFQGIGNLENTGLACSNLGLALRAIRDAHMINRTTNTTKRNACVLGNVQIPFDIGRYHEKCAIEKEMMAYDALDLKDKTWKDVIELAAEMAEMSPLNFIKNPLVPIMKYYELDPKTKLGPEEEAIVLYIDEFQVMIGIATESNGKYFGTHSSFDQTIINRFDKHLIDEMYKVVKPKIELLNISVSEEDKEEFAKQVLNVKKQFKRNKKASVVFNNGWIDYSEPLSVQVLEQLFKELLDSCEMLLQDLITVFDGVDETLEYLLPEIKKLYLAGPMTDYKVLWDLIKKENPFGGKKELILCGELENVVIRGLTLL